MKVFRNIKETEKFAEKLAQKLVRFGPKEKAKVIGLIGELGAGKTAFTQAFARALGIHERVVSPTFVLEKIYKLPKGKQFKHLVHIDAYRLESEDEIVRLGWREIVSNPLNIILVEWADKIKKIMPKNADTIKLEHFGANKRKITLKWKKTTKNQKA